MTIAAMRLRSLTGFCLAALSLAAACGDDDKPAARLGGDVSGFVHPAVQAALKQKWQIR